MNPFLMRRRDLVRSDSGFSDVTITLGKNRRYGDAFLPAILNFRSNFVVEHTEPHLQQVLEPALGPLLNNPLAT